MEEPSGISRLSECIAHDAPVPCKAVNEDLTELLPRIRQDTLLIWGDLDTATPIADAKLMEEKIPGAGLAVIPGTGHFSFLENPALFRSIMQAYFA